MDINKFISEYEAEFLLWTADSTDAQNLKWLRENYIVVNESDRKSWMPLIQQFKYPDVSRDKFFYEFNEEDKKKLLELQEKSYPLKIESHYTARQLVEVCIMYLREISTKLVEPLSKPIENIISIYKDFLVKNRTFLLANIPNDKQEFVRKYLNYLIDRLLSEKNIQLNHIPIGEILKIRGLAQIKL